MKSNLILLAIVIATASATLTTVTIYNTADEQSGSSPGGTACAHLNQYNRIGQSRGSTYLGFPIGNLVPTDLARFYLKGARCVNANKINFRISTLEDPTQGFTELNSTSQCQFYTTGNSTAFTISDDISCTSEGIDVTDAFNAAKEAGNDQLVLTFIDTVMTDYINFCSRYATPNQEPHYNDNSNCGLLANSREYNPSSFFIIVTQNTDEKSTEQPESTASPSSGESSESETPQSTSSSPEGPSYSCQPPCHNESCCTCLQMGNPQTGTGYLEYQEECLDGGLHCVDNSGCLLCYRPVEGGHNFGNRPVCDRFGGSYDPNANCTDDACCIDFQGNNEDDGNGYLEYYSGCYNNSLGTENCIQDHVGCRLCFKPGNGHTNVGNRPVCRRFQDKSNLDAINQFERANADFIQGVGNFANTLNCLFILISFMYLL